MSDYIGTPRPRPLRLPSRKCPFTLTLSTPTDECKAASSPVLVSKPPTFFLFFFFFFFLLMCATSENNAVKFRSPPPPPLLPDPLHSPQLQGICDSLLADKLSFGPIKPALHFSDGIMQRADKLLLALPRRRGGPFQAPLCHRSSV